MSQKLDYEEYLALQDFRRRRGRDDMEVDVQESMESRSRYMVSSKVRQHRPLFLG